MLGQFDNPANPEIHFKTTGPEIWNDCAGVIDVLVAGIGTGETITGVSRYIKNEAGKAIESVAVEPSQKPVITQTMNVVDDLYRYGRSEDEVKNFDSPSETSSPDGVTSEQESQPGPDSDDSEGSQSLSD